jgi:endonuclease/exonuclease/phosphatase (EEP) superfamily protein YafD
VRAFDSIIQIYKLIDVYRTAEPAGRECNFYNDHYKSGSRLDRIYMPRLNIDCILRVEHLPVALSDHKAVRLH